MSHARASAHHTYLTIPIVAALFLASGCGGNGEDPVVPPVNGNGDPPPEAGVISGTVSHQGEGVGSVHILLRDGPGGDREATTPNEGTFSFQDVEPGSWELEVTPPDYFELASGEDAVRSIEVTEGGTTSVTIGLAPPEELEPVEIATTSGLAFAPSEAEVAPGTRVRWVNTSTELHTVTPEGHSEWSEATLSSEGDEFETVMNNPGTFDYFCVPHQGDGMVGVLTVSP